MSTPGAATTRTRSASCSRRSDVIAITRTTPRRSSVVRRVADWRGDQDAPGRGPRTTSRIRSMATGRWRSGRAVHYASGRVPPRPLLQPLDAPFRRRRPVHGLRRVLHGPTRQAQRGPLTARAGGYPVGSGARRTNELLGFWQCREAEPRIPRSQPTDRLVAARTTPRFVTTIQEMRELSLSVGSRRSCSEPTGKRSCSRSSTATATGSATRGATCKARVTTRPLPRLDPQSPRAEYSLGAEGRFQSRRWPRRPAEH